MRNGQDKGMTSRHIYYRSDMFGRLAVLAGRVLLGLVLATALSMVALAIAWGLYIFSGVSERVAFMVVTMGSGGLGAGIAANIAWIRLDRQQRTGFALTLLLCVAGGVVGALLGYQFGANREFDCCSEPRTNPFTYSAIGASIGANVVMYLVVAVGAAARAFRLRRKAAQG